jgi:hypothetical protein
MYIYIRTNARTFSLKDQKKQLELPGLWAAEVRTARLSGSGLTCGNCCLLRAGGGSKSHTGKLLIEKGSKKELPEEEVSACQRIIPRSTAECPDRIGRISLPPNPKNP